MKEIETIINIKIKLKDGKTLNLDFEDGRKLLAELTKIYKKGFVQEMVPFYEYHEPYPLQYTWEPSPYQHPIITCQNSSIQ